jgi:hypothetical protein
MNDRRASRIAVLAATLALAVTPFTTGATPAVADETEPAVTTPDNVNVDVGTSSVQVDWDPSTSNAGVTIYYLKLNGQWHWTDATEKTFHLPKSTTYTVTIQAQDAAYNRSDWSDPVEFTTPDEFPVTTPANVRVDTSPGTVTVQWDASASDAGVMDYLATLHGGRGGPVSQRTTDATATFTHPPGGDLSVTVQARDEAYRWSDTSDPVPFALPPTEDWAPPSTPGNFRAANSERGVLFQWDEPTEGVAPFTYHIFLDGSEVDTVRGDLELDSPYFTECTQPWQTPAEFTITATSYGFESPPSEPITLCFR